MQYCAARCMPDGVSAVPGEFASAPWLALLMKQVAIYNCQKRNWFSCVVCGKDCLQMGQNRNCYCSKACATKNGMSLVSRKQVERKEDDMEDNDYKYNVSKECSKEAEEWLFECASCCCIVSGCAAAHCNGKLSPSPQNDTAC